MAEADPEHLPEQEQLIHRSWRRAGRGGPRVFADFHTWLALLLAVPAMLPLLAPGYFFEAHDARHSVYFLVEFDRAFRAGALWPVWGPDLAVGFGYPLWLVYAPLPYFAAQAFHLLGLGFTAAIKATWALGFLLGALGTYRLARRWWGPAAGLVASVAFTYAPYHLVQIYVRAALAEFLALAWLPWAVLALVALWEAPAPRRVAPAALAVAVLLMLHTVSMLTFVPLIAGLILVLLLRDLWLARGDTRRPLARAMVWTGAGAALGGLLASIFLVPMVLERSYIVEAQWVHATYNYRQHFVYLSQFLDATWGYGYSVAGAEDGMSFQLGPLVLLVAVLGAKAAVSARPAGVPHRVEALFLALASVGALFLMTPGAVWLWDTLPFMELVQFPWRLLAVEVFTLALLAGAGTRWLDRQVSARYRLSPFPFVLALGIILASFSYVRPQLVPIRPQDETPLAVIEFELEFSDMRGVTRWSERVPRDADSPLIAYYLAGEEIRRAAIVAGEGEIVAQEAGAMDARAHVQAAGPVRLRFFTYYFPGWHATLDGQPIDIAPDPPNGLIGIDIPAGEHEVVLSFGPTPVRRTAAAVSAAALLAVVALALSGVRSRPVRLAETEV